MNYNFFYGALLLLFLLGCHHDERVYSGGTINTVEVHDKPDFDIDEYNFDSFVKDVEDRKKIPIQYFQNEFGIKLSEAVYEIYGNSVCELDGKQKLVQLNGFRKHGEVLKKCQFFFLLFSDGNTLLDYEIMDIEYEKDALVDYSDVEKNKFYISIFMYTGRMPNLLKDFPISKKEYSVAKNRIIEIED